MALRWSDTFLPQLVAIYGDEQTADEAMFTIDWQLARDPELYTWPLSEGSDIRLGWIRSFRGFPAVYFTFEMIDEDGHRFPLLLEARHANEPELS